jgi:hypothetical protein
MTSNCHNGWICCELVSDSSTTFGGTLVILRNEFESKTFNSPCILHPDGGTLGDIHTK